MPTSNPPKPFAFRGGRLLAQDGAESLVEELLIESERVGQAVEALQEE